MKERFRAVRGRGSLLGGAIILISALIFGIAFGGEGTPAVFIVGSIGTEPETVQVIRELEPGTRLSSGEYVIRAAIAQRTARAKVAHHVTELHSALALGNIRLGVDSNWTEDAGQYIWVAPRNDQKQENHLRFEVDGQGIALDEFDELQFAYDIAGTGTDISVSTQLEIASRHENKSIRKVSIIEGGQLEALHAIETAGSAWQPRDRLFLIKRLFGLARDADWRYTADRGNSVVQRRFNLPLTSVEAIDIEGLTDNIERVNLRISGPGWLPNTHALLWEHLRPQRFDRAGKKVLRISLANLPPKYAGNLAESSLQEVLIFIKGQPVESAWRSAVQRVVLRGNRTDATEDTKKEIDTMYLTPKRTVEYGGVQRLSVDLKPIRDKLGRDALLRRAIVTVEPSEAAWRTTFRWRTIRAIQHRSIEMPVVWKYGSEQSRTKWWGPYFGPTELDSIEWVRIDAHAPLDKFGLSIAKTDKVKTAPADILCNNDESSVAGECVSISPRASAPRGQSNVLENMSFPVTALPKVSGRHIKIAGLTLEARNLLHTSFVPGEGLVVVGHGREVSIVWPVSTRIGQNERLSMGITEKSNRVARVEVQADSNMPGRRAAVGRINEETIMLGFGARKINDLNMRVIFNDDGPFVFSIRDLTLFEPKLIPTQAVLMEPILQNVQSELLATNVDAAGAMRIENATGGIHLTMVAKEEDEASARWDYRIDKKITEIENLWINYGIRISGKDKKQISLRLLFVSAGKSYVYDTWLHGDKDINLPLRDALIASGASMDDTLESIRFVIKDSSGDASKNAPVLLRFTVRLATVEEISIINQLENWRIATVNGTPMFPRIQRGKNLFLTGNSYEDVELGRIRLNADQDISTVLHSSAHPFFSVERLVLEKTDGKFPLQMYIAKAANDKTAPVAWDNVAIGLLVPGLLISLIVWVRKSIKHFFVRSLTSTKTCFRIVRAEINRAINRARGWLSITRNYVRTIALANRFVGLIALGPGLWLAGSEVTRNGSIVALVATVAVAFSAVFHEIRYQVRKRAWPGTPVDEFWVGSGHLIPDAVWIVSLVLLSGVAWYLGHRGLDLKHLWPLLFFVYLYIPWIAKLFQLFFVYLYIPWIAKLFQKNLRINRSGGTRSAIVCWLSVSMACYAGGSIINISTIADILIIGGGASVVLAWRSGMAQLFRRTHAHISTIAAPEKRYFIGFLVFFSLAMTILALGWAPMAEQVTLIAYYMITTGVVVKLRELWRAQRQPPETQSL